MLIPPRPSALPGPDERAPGASVWVGTYTCTRRDGRRDTAGDPGDPLFELLALPAETLGAVPDREHSDLEVVMVDDGVTTTSASSRQNSATSAFAWCASPTAELP